LNRAFPWFGLGLGVLSALGAAQPARAQDCTIDPQIVNTRPGAAGVPTDVQVGIYVLDIVAVDDIDQTFTADLYLSIYWQDSRLSAAARGSSLAGCGVPLSSIWHPFLDVVNQRDLRAFYPEVVRVDEAGNVLYNQRFYGALSSPLDLHDFPFDRQSLGISVASRRYDTDEVLLRVDELRTGRLGPFSVAGWGLELAEPRAGTLFVAPQGRELARMDFLIDGDREIGYYLVKIFLPLGLIIFMAWNVFWLDPLIIPSRIGVSTATIIALVAFLYRIGQVLPRIGYLTRIDQFILGAMVLVFGALGESVLSSRWAKRDELDKCARLDAWARAGFAVAFGGLVVFTLWL
jgi:hypothetical protein